MERGYVTTPFGRRSVTLALVKSQMETSERRSDRSVDKWKLFRDVCEAREPLGLQDRTLAVLNALLSFYPESVLSEEHGLVVFPSNAQLSIRAHGIAGTTLRRHLAILVDAALIQRRDSPNGKRYAHKGRDGGVEEAFGFSLSPLLARAGEIAGLAQQVAEERQQFKRAREALTLCRRDIRKLISAAIEEGADGDWLSVEAHYLGFIRDLPRTPNRSQLEAALDNLVMLRDEIVNMLEIQVKTENRDGNDGQNGRHIQNSNPDSINELEPCSEKELEGETVLPQEIAKSFPLGMVLKSCPQIADYAPDGAISGWRDLMAAAVVVRSMLGVSPSAYQAACDAMGPENAATAMACILERANHIQSAGGYLRDLTRRAERGEFHLGPMLMALFRASGAGLRAVS